MILFQVGGNEKEKRHSNHLGGNESLGPSAFLHEENLDRIETVLCDTADGLPSAPGGGGGAKAKRFRHSAYEGNFKGSTMSEGGGGGAGGLFRGVQQEFLHLKNSLLETATGRGSTGGGDYKNKRKR